jgi:hypothetical protein
METGKAAAVFLHPWERLTGVTKEWHTRKRNGRDMCYVIVDRSGKVALLTQKLLVASDFINANLVDPDEPWSRVTTTGLWEILDQTSGRVGGWHKGRFRVISVDLKNATACFEAVRSSHERSAVIGEPRCYCIDS